MLKDSYTFNSYSTNDIAASKTFYKEILGLEVKEDEMGFLEISAAGSNAFVIYPKENHKPASFTVLNFEVKDIENKVGDLMGRGITFEQYPEPMKTDKKGIYNDGRGVAIAWFKDPAGNVLSLIEEIK